MALVIETYVVSLGTIALPTTLVDRSAQFTSVKINCEREELPYMPLSVRAEAMEKGAFKNGFSVKANFSTHTIKRVFFDLLQSNVPVLMTVSPNGGTPTAENPEFRATVHLFKMPGGGDSMKLEDIDLEFKPYDGQMSIWYAAAGADKIDLF